MPRRPRVRAELRAKKGATRKLGMAPSPRSASDWTWRASRESAPSTEMAIGVSCRLVARFWAVTTTSSRLAAAASAAAASAARAMEGASASMATPVSNMARDVADSINRFILFPGRLGPLSGPPGR